MCREPTRSGAARRSERGGATAPAATSTAAPPAALGGAAVLVVGVGGLGNPAALALARAGIGRLGLVDGDAIDLSNLPRQILFRDGDLGQPKVEAAAARLRVLAAGTRIETHACRVEASDRAAAAALFRAYDFVVDATDSFAAKYFLNDLALATDRPLAHAGVTGERGQLLTVLPGQSACLRCVFPEPAAADDGPGCSTAGVFGPLVGVFGTLQAGEALKYLGGSGALFRDRLLVSDGGRWRTLAVARDAGCAACGARRDAAPGET